MAQPAPADKMITIIGAGIAGLSLGWRLASAGVEVTILEKSKIASGASGAAGAYLEPRPGTGKLRALEWASHKMWPEFAKQLEQQSGIDIGFCASGVTYIAYQDGVEKLKRAADYHRSSGWQLKWLDDKRIQEFEPALSKQVKAAYHLPQVCQVDARLTCNALALAFRQLGGRLIEDTGVTEIIDTGKGLTLNCIDGLQIHTDILVIAAGHGTNKVGGLPDDILNSRPVRGVMLELAQPSDQPLIRHPIKRPDGVIMPLLNGNLLVGSSHEEGESEIVASDNIVNDMRKSATKALPEIADLPLVETRIGIRALIGDGLLRLGRSGKMPNVYYSLSHAGAGFLRAPLIAKELADTILGHGNDKSMILPFFKS